jgi:hypothetical protein
MSHFISPDSALYAALMSCGIDPNAPISKAEKLRNQAEKMQKEAHAMLDRIPAGQPIMSVRDRNLREKSMEKSRKACELHKQADELDAGKVAK